MPTIGALLLLAAVVASGSSLILSAMAERSTIDGERRGISPAVAIVREMATPGFEAFRPAAIESLVDLGYRSGLAFDPEAETYALATALTAQIPSALPASPETFPEATIALRDTVRRSRSGDLVPTLERLVREPAGQTRRQAAAALERAVASDLDRRLAARASAVAVRTAMLVALGLFTAFVGVAMLGRTLIAVRRGLAAERQAREAAQRQLALADATPVGLWTTEADATTVTWVSSRFAELTGIDDLAALGNGWFQHVHPDDRTAVTSSLAAVCNAAPALVPPYRYRIVDLNGVERAMREEARPVYRDGRLVAFAGSTMDVTDEERAHRTVVELATASARGLDLARQVLQAGTLDAAFAACAGCLAEAGVRWTALFRATVDGRRAVVTSFTAPAVVDERVLAEADVTSVAVGSGAVEWGRLAVAGTAPEHLLPMVASILASAILRLEAESRLAHDARHEPGSGLLRRAAFADVVTDAAAGGPVTVVAFDVVDLDMIGDREGRGACEHLLTRSAIRIAAAAAADLPSRLGRLGDTSIGLLLAGRDVARREEIISALVDLEQSPGGLRGAWAAGEEGVDGGPLVEHAETALAHAHRARLAAVAYDDDFARRMSSRIQLDGDLRRAITNNELFLQFQPIVDLATGAIRRGESLVRWRAADGMRGPDSFVPYAEESGLIVPLGRIVMFEACRVAARMVRELGDRAVPITINVSAEQLTRDDLAAVVQSALVETGCPPSAIALELTETAYLADTSESRSALEIVRALGVKLLLDDFGTGYSSLGTLHEVRADAIKLDRSLIASFGESTTSTAIVAAAIAMTRALGIDTVAEGVETPAQAAILQAAGCRYGQGWLFAKAMDEDDFIAYVANDRRLGIAA